MAPWLICLGCAVWIANQVITFIHKMRGPDAFPPNASLGEAHNSLRERIINIEKSIEAIWTEMREEDADTRKEMQQFAKDIERAVGRLEGLQKDRNP